MSNLKALFISIPIWFVLLFKLDVLVPEGFSDPNVGLVIFGTACVIGMATLIIPRLARISMVTTFGIVLAAYTALYIYLVGSNGNTSIYDYLLGVFALGITMVLVRKAANAFLDFTDASEMFLFGGKNDRLMPYAQGEEEINHELYRARRFDRPVAMVYCTLPKNATDDKIIYIHEDFVKWHITKTFRQRYRTMQIIRHISSLTYKSDVMVEYGEGVVVCLPETNEAEAKIFINQLGKMISTNLGVNPHIGIACFPNEGLVFDELAAEAVKKTEPWTNQDDMLDDSTMRRGDVMVELEKRLKIESSTAWVDRMSYNNPEMRKVYSMLKRGFDITAVMLAMPLVLPVVALAGLAIYLQDGGSIFYMQPRTGYGGKRFEMFKLRTMVENAAVVPPRVVALANGEVRYQWPEKVANDNRITAVGAFLRKTSLDELPQLFNVLTGDMSLIGPRPTTWDVDKYTKHQTARLTVRPGITGLWQVSARDATNMDERLLWDLKYIDNMSMLLDLKIMWMTVTQVFKKGGV